MKSPMVMTATYTDAKHKSGYSDLQVMQSGAGFYVGTIFTDPEEGFQEPGSRDSDYFSTRELAQTFLDELIAGEPKELRLRP